MPLSCRLVLDGRPRTVDLDDHENRPRKSFSFVSQTFPSNKFPRFVFVNAGPHSPGRLKKERYY
jgi:hypothetical protein